MTDTASEKSYVDYFAALGLTDECKPGEVRKNYKKMMRDLVVEIHQTRLSGDRRDMYLLQMAQMNAAFYILRDNERRERYVEDRKQVIASEEEWRHAAAQGVEPGKAELMRRAFDNALRHFLSTYMEELMLEAGRDAECVEASGWDPYHERHASRVLRHHRQRLYQEIHERLPYYDVTPPRIDWDERRRMAAAIIAEGV